MKIVQAVAALISMLFLACLSAQCDEPAGGKMKEERFMGHSVKSEDAFDKSDLVVIAKIADLGVAEPGSPGQSFFGNVRLKVEKSLKGKAEDSITVSLTLQKFPQKVAEVLPQKEEDYIFFVKKLSDQQLSTIKILRASPENVKGAKGGKGSSPDK